MTRKKLIFFKIYGTLLHKKSDESSLLLILIGSERGGRTHDLPGMNRTL